MDVSPVLFRPRLVALGNYQTSGVDYHETFSPVTRMASFRLLLGLAAKLSLKVYASDFSTAYLNAYLKIKQYVSSVPGFTCKPECVWMVDKALYGLHQSGRKWNEELDKFLQKIGYMATQTESYLYWK